MVPVLMAGRKEPSERNHGNFPGLWAGPGSLEFRHLHPNLLLGADPVFLLVPGPARALQVQLIGATADFFLQVQRWVQIHFDLDRGQLAVRLFARLARGGRGAGCSGFRHKLPLLKIKETHRLPTDV
jgi:hypothetical protein